MECLDCECVRAAVMLIMWRERVVCVCVLWGRRTDKLTGILIRWLCAWRWVSAWERPCTCVDLTRCILAAVKFGCVLCRWVKERVADLGRFVLCSRLPGPAISGQPSWSTMSNKSQRQDGECFQGRRCLHTRKQLSTVPSLDLRDIPQNWVAPAPWSVLDLAFLRYRPH